MTYANPYELIDRRLSAIEKVLQELRQQNQVSVYPTHTPDIAPILNAKQIKDMTGWPNGTFYAKVAEMPDGVVIRGKSKRLLFDREAFFTWLKTPIEL